MWRLPHQQQPVHKHWPRQGSGVTRADGERQTRPQTGQHDRRPLSRCRDLDAPGANSCTRYTCLPSSKAPYSAMMWSCTSPEWICISRATCSPAYGPDYASRTGMCQTSWQEGRCCNKCSPVLGWSSNSRRISQTRRRFPGEQHARKTAPIGSPTHLVPVQGGQLVLAVQLQRHRLVAVAAGGAVQQAGLAAVQLLHQVVIVNTPALPSHRHGSDVHANACGTYL